MAAVGRLRYGAIPIRWMTLVLISLLVSVASIAQTQTVSGISINPSPVVGGKQAIGTVNISSVAPSGGITVQLSSDAGCAVVAPTVTVPHGRLKASFQVNTSVVSSTTPAAITASTGVTSATSNLSVLAPTVSSLTVTPSPVVGGYAVKGTVTLAVAAPAGGWNVALSSDQPFVSFPYAVTVKPGNHAATFLIRTTGVGAPGTATLTASAGGIPASTDLTIMPPAVTAVSLSADSVPGETAVTGKVTVSLPAPAGGETVQLSSDSVAAHVPATIVIPASDRTRTFKITTSITTAATHVNISAAAGDSNASAILTVQGSGLADSPWPKFHRDNFNTGLGMGQGSNGQLKWTPVSGVFSPSPVIGFNDTIYVSSGGGIALIDGATGARKSTIVLTNWTADFGIAIGADSTLFASGSDGAIHALDGTTGESKWSFQTQDGDALSQPAIGANGTVYTGDQSTQFVYGLDGATGAEKWHFEGVRDPIGYSMSSPTIGADGTVYIAGSEKERHWLASELDYDEYYLGYLYALDGNTGALKWRFSPGRNATGDAIFLGPPAIGADGTVYIACHDGNLYAFDGGSGAKKWTFSTGSYFNESSPAIGADGTVYVGCQDLSIYALDGNTGAKKWTFSPGGDISAFSPAIGGDGSIYISAGAHDVYALDRTTGSVKWNFSVTGSIGSSPVIGSDGTVYICSANGVLYALGTTGSPASQTVRAGRQRLRSRR